MHSAKNLLGTVAGILDGEILRTAGDLTGAIKAFEKAVELEDALTYDEPEPLPFAARHWLGAALLEAGRYADAERVYREELDDHPHNGWSLLGLQKALAGRGVKSDRGRRRFRRELVARRRVDPVVAVLRAQRPQRRPTALSSKAVIRRGFGILCVVLAVAASACDDDSQDEAPSDGVEQITGNERIGWQQAAASEAELSNVSLTTSTSTTSRPRCRACRVPRPPSGGFSCSGSLPADAGGPSCARDHHLRQRHDGSRARARRRSPSPSDRR